jgi:hypothetical protein
LRSDGVVKVFDRQREFGDREPLDHGDDRVHVAGAGAR